MSKNKKNQKEGVKKVKIVDEVGFKDSDSTEEVIKKLECVD